MVAQGGSADEVPESSSQPVHSLNKSMDNDEVPDKQGGSGGAKGSSQDETPPEANRRPTAKLKIKRGDNANSRCCSEESCSRRPFFGLPGAKPTLCSRHARKSEGMVDVSSRRCEASGCTKWPLYGIEGQKAKFCSIHKLAGMIDVRSRRCQSESCKRQPSYGFDGSKACFCAAHKVEGMVDVVSRRCEKALCRRRPLYGFEGQKSRFCSNHKAEGMVDVCNRRCEAEGCVKRPCFGYPGQRATFCATHRSPTMLDVITHKCGYPGCKQTPRLEAHGRRAKFCVKHMTDGQAGASLLQLSMAKSSKERGIDGNKKTLPAAKAETSNRSPSPGRASALTQPSGPGPGSGPVPDADSVATAGSPQASAVGLPKGSRVFVKVEGSSYKHKVFSPLGGSGRGDCGEEGGSRHQQPSSNSNPVEMSGGRGVLFSETPVPQGNPAPPKPSLQGSPPPLVLKQQQQHQSTPDVLQGAVGGAATHPNSPLLSASRQGDHAEGLGPGSGGGGGARAGLLDPGGGTCFRRRSSLATPAPSLNLPSLSSSLLMDQEDGLSRRPGGEGLSCSQKSLRAVGAGFTRGGSDGALPGTLPSGTASAAMPMPVGAMTVPGTASLGAQPQHHGYHGGGSQQGLGALVDFPQGVVGGSIGAGGDGGDGEEVCGGDSSRGGGSGSLMGDRQVAVGLDFSSLSPMGANASDVGVGDAEAHTSSRHVLGDGLRGGGGGDALGDASPLPQRSSGEVGEALLSSLLGPVPDLRWSDMSPEHLPAENLQQGVGVSSQPMQSLETASMPQSSSAVQGQGRGQGLGINQMQGLHQCLSLGGERGPGQRPGQQEGGAEMLHRRASAFVCYPSALPQVVMEPRRRESAFVTGARAPKRQRLPHYWELLSALPYKPVTSATGAGAPPMESTASLLFHKEEEGTGTGGHDALVHQGSYGGDQSLLFEGDLLGPMGDNVPIRGGSGGECGVGEGDRGSIDGGGSSIDREGGSIDMVAGLEAPELGSSHPPHPGVVATSPSPSHQAPSSRGMSSKRLWSAVPTTTVFNLPVRDGTVAPTPELGLGPAHPAWGMGAECPDTQAPTRRGSVALGGSVSLAGGGGNGGNGSGGGEGTTTAAAAAAAAAGGWGLTVPSMGDGGRFQRVLGAEQQLQVRSGTYSAVQGPPGRGGAQPAAVAAAVGLIPRQQPVQQDRSAMVSLGTPLGLQGGGNSSGATTGQQLLNMPLPPWQLSTNGGRVGGQPGELQGSALQPMLQRRGSLVGEGTGLQPGQQSLPGLRDQGFGGQGQLPIGQQGPAIRRLSALQGQMAPQPAVQPTAMTRRGSVMGSRGASLQPQGTPVFMESAMGPPPMRRGSVMVAEVGDPQGLQGSVGSIPQPVGQLVDPLPSRRGSVAGGITDVPGLPVEENQVSQQYEGASSILWGVVGGFLPQASSGLPGTGSAWLWETPPRQDTP